MWKGELLDCGSFIKPSTCVRLDGVFVMYTHIRLEFITISFGKF
jgi:hypothetical protein